MIFDTIDSKRQSRRIPIVEFCRDIGIDESTYYRWRAEPQRMKTGTLLKIVKYLGMTNQEKLNLFR